MTPEAHDRVKGRMDRVDRMQPEMRELVHEFGLTMIDQFVTCGVTKPKHIRHLINTVRAGSVEIGDRRDNPMLHKHEGWPG